MAGFNLAKVPGWALALTQDARVAHLGLLDYAGLPRVLPVTFALAGNAVYSAVDQKPKRVLGEELARVRFLRRRPEVALTVDRYDDDWSRLAWVQLLGTIELSDPSAHPAGLAALVAKYADYAERPPAGPLLRLVPTRGLWWRAAEAGSGGGHPGNAGGASDGAI
jgi:PPOX class probable F420-dependent enzyme